MSSRWGLRLALAVLAVVAAWGCASRIGTQVVRSYATPSGVVAPSSPVLVVPVVLAAGTGAMSHNGSDTRTWRQELASAMRDELRAEGSIPVLSHRAIGERLRGLMRLEDGYPLVRDRDQALRAARETGATMLVLGELRRHFTGGLSGARLELAVSLFSVTTGDVQLRVEGRIEAAAGASLFKLDQPVPVPRDLLRRLVRDTFHRGVFPSVRRQAP